MFSSPRRTSKWTVRGALLHSLFNDGNAAYLFRRSCQSHDLVAGNDTPLGPNGTWHGQSTQWRTPTLAEHEEELTSPIYDFAISRFQYDEGIYCSKAADIPSAPFYIMGQDEFMVG